MSTYSKTRLEKLAVDICLTRARIRHLRRALLMKKQTSLAPYNAALLEEQKAKLNRLLNEMTEEIMLNYSSDWYNSFLSFFNSSEDNTKFVCTK